MTLEDLSKDINRLKEKVEQPQKDAWDKWQVIGTLLGSVMVPVALAVVGYYFSRTLTIQQIRSSEEVATNNLRLGQYQIVAGLMKSLISPDSGERKQAMNFVFIVITDVEARRLLDRLSESDADPTVRAYATNTLNARLNELTTDAVNPNQQISQAAYGHLTNVWQNDPRLTKTVLAAVEKSGDNENSLAKTLNVLATLDARQIQQHSNDVARFIHRIPTNTPKFQQSVSQLRTKLQTRD